MITIVRPQYIGWHSCAKISLQCNGKIVVVKHGQIVLGGEITGLVVPWGIALKKAKINTAQAIANASFNKGAAREMMASNGVPVPRIWNGKDDPVFPMIARPFSHHKGKELYLIQNKNDLDACPITIHNGYFAGLFDKTGEYRVHCAHGKVLFIEDKHYKKGGDIRANQAVTHEGWTIVPWKETKNTVMKQAMRTALLACEVLGLDYGGVDVMVNTDNNEVAVCEVNTAPTLDGDYTSGKYAKYFLWLNKHGTKTAHWKWKGFKRALSFFWKDKQLNG